MCALLVWTLVAYGGSLPWTLWPAAALVAAIALMVPRHSGGARSVFIAGAIVAAAVAVQLLPLPERLLAALDPHGCDYVRTMMLGASRAGCPATRVSVDAHATALGLGVLVGALLVFRACVDLFAVSGIRRIVLGAVVTGVIVGLAAGAHQAIYGARAYWWRPLATPLDTFGPFVNRNHFATWLIMAAPLAAGFLLTRASALPRARGQRMGRRLDAGLLSLAIACAVLVVLVLLTASRSGLIGLAAGLAAGAWIARRRIDGRAVAALGLAVAGVAVLAAIAGDLAFVVARAEQTMREGVGGRAEIWHDAWRIVRAFWPAGSGVGTFSEVMTLYQTADPRLHFNQAHSQYLQVAAEGGLLVSIPSAIAVILLVRAAVDGLRRDRSGLWWTRVGAAAALIAVAVQSIWETGLRMPANAALFAVVAALAVHAPRHAGDTEGTLRSVTRRAARARRSGAGHGVATTPPRLPRWGPGPASDGAGGSGGAKPPGSEC